MLGEGPELAYLSYMANRLRECHRALRDDGSLYLHCDPTMSHKLKLVLDAIFGKHNFRNEIIWKRTTAHSLARKYHARVHDIILYYSKSDAYLWHQLYTPYEDEYIRTKYRHIEPETGRRYQLDNATATGNTPYEVMGVTKPYRFSPDNMQRLIEAGRIVQPRPGAVPRYKRYLDEMPGLLSQDIWTDIQPLNSQAKERIGYPTQKPLALLERILNSSNPDYGVVMDPFCGCGTTIHAAQNLGMPWIGIDVCAQACKVIQNRIESHFDSLWDDIEFVGMPKTIDDAKTLAEYDKPKFEKWAASLTPGMEANKKQVADGGIDGRGRYPLRKGEFVDVVSQVKGGMSGLGPMDVQAFNGARQQANADMGVFTCFEEKVTNGMRDAAVNAGRFQNWPVLQIYTVQDYFAERKPDLPLAA